MNVIPSYTGKQKTANNSLEEESATNKQKRKPLELNKRNKEEMDSSKNRKEKWLDIHLETTNVNGRNNSKEKLRGVIARMKKETKM